MKTKLAAICLSLIVSAQAPLALAQSAQLSSDQAWDLVKQTMLGEKLEVKLKDGRKVKGEMVLASDSELSLSLKNQQAAQFKRDEVREVRRVLPSDSDKKRFYSGVGVGAGLIVGVGVALAISQSNRDCHDCRGRAMGLTTVLVGFPVIGSMIGRKLGGSGKRILLYKAP
ncbi:MAG: hypothetical protein ACREAB_02760 [Blastocatellia bacterium]